MAHFAKLLDGNKVETVIVVDNKVLLDENGEEQESLGIQFLQDLYGESTVWKQCSYNSSFRLLYPRPGSFYLPDHDIFTHPKPFNSWILDTSTGEYSAPVSLPDYNPETHNPVWDEDNQTWLLVLNSIVNVT